MCSCPFPWGQVVRWVFETEVVRWVELSCRSWVLRSNSLEYVVTKPLDLFFFICGLEEKTHFPFKDWHTFACIWFVNLPFCVFLSNQFGLTLHNKSIFFLRYLHRGLAACILHLSDVQNGDRYSSVVYCIFSGLTACERVADMWSRQPESATCIARTGVLETWIKLVLNDILLNSRFYSFFAQNIVIDQLNH